MTTQVEIGPGPAVDGLGPEIRSRRIGTGAHAPEYAAAPLAPASAAVSLHSSLGRTALPDTSGGSLEGLARDRLYRAQVPTANADGVRSTRMAEAVIEVDELRRAYGPVEAVRGISLTVRRGELFALLGTNGAGKTTTIEVLEGLQSPTAGRVRVLGLDPIRDRAIVRRRTGMMLQSGGFTGALTVRETLELWQALTPAPRNIAEVLDIVDLSPLVDVAVEHLSGGEHRRLELALAILGRPELLFLDEPTSGMDPASRRRTWDVVRALLREGVTVLLTTHYLEEAEALADRVSIMHEGTIVVTGTPEEVVGRLPARITFRAPDTPARLPTFPGASVGVDGERVTVRSRQLQGDLGRLLRWADDHAVELVGLTARPASLEDVFLSVIDGAAGPTAAHVETAGR